MGLTLIDNFNDNVIDLVLWPASFGTRSEVGGRARVACDVGFSGYSSASIYALRESSVQVRLFPPAAGGAATAWGSLIVNTPLDGTDLLTEVNAATGKLIMSSRVGYSDANAVSIPYSATDHAWLRIHETVGTTYWETSPDGATWTTRRSAPSPAWASATTSRVELIAHRDAGTVDFAEFDDLSLTPVMRDLTLAASLEPDRWAAEIEPNRWEGTVPWPEL